MNPRMLRSLPYLILMVSFIVMGTVAYTAPRGLIATYAPLVQSALDPLPDRPLLLATIPEADRNDKTVLISAITGEQRQLTYNSTEESYASASPDGNIVLFQKVDNPDLGYYTVRADGGGNQQRLCDCYGAQWAADSSAVAYQTYRSDGYELMLAPLNTSTPFTLTTHTTLNFGWTPDSSSLVYAAAPTGQLDIYRIDRDGSGETRLYGTPYPDYFYGVLADGRLVIGTQTGNTLTLVRLNADGTNPIPLFTTTSAVEDIFIEYDPTGRFILPRYNTFYESDNVFRLYTVEGSVVWSLSDLCQGVLPDDNCYIQEVTWRPDGSEIIFSLFRELPTFGYAIELYQIRTDGSETTPRLIGVGAQNPRLDSTGRYLAYEVPNQNTYDDQQVRIRDLQTNGEIVIDHPDDVVRLWEWLPN